MLQNRMLTTMGTAPMTQDKQDRYFFGTDCSGHWYIVPVSKSDSWFKWANLDEDNPKAWKAPKYSKMISRPENITFTDPQ